MSSPRRSADNDLVSAAAREFGRRGGKARAAKLSKRELSLIGRLAGIASGAARSRKRVLNLLEKAEREDAVGVAPKMPGQGAK